MNVKELITILQTLPEESIVKFSYVYDGIETVESDVDTVTLDIDGSVIFT